MAVYVVTGKLGGGKTLACVDRINDALAAGRRVATNLDLSLHRLPYVGRYAKAVSVLRVPDRPSAADIEALGYGIPGVHNAEDARRLYDEKRFGILVLDECGTWFNARDWSEDGRRELVNTLLHIRKRAWHVYLIVQDISMLDKQARKALAEHVVYCRRLDRLSVPFVGFWWQRITGSKMPLPQVHVAIVKYGDRPDSLTVERWFYRGGHLYAAYDTTQVFSASYPHGLYQVLPPFYVFGGAQTSWTWVNAMRLTRIVFRKYSLALLLAAGVALGAAFVSWRTSAASEAREAAHAAELEQLRADQSAAATAVGAQGDAVQPSGPFTVVEESSIAPGVWTAWFQRDGVMTHSEDLPGLGYRVTRIGSCAYRLTPMSGRTVVARCARASAPLQGVPTFSAAKAKDGFP